MEVYWRVSKTKNLILVCIAYAYLSWKLLCDKGNLNSFSIFTKNSFKKLNILWISNDYDFCLNLNLLFLEPFRSFLVGTKIFLQATRILVLIPVFVSRERFSLGFFRDLTRLPTCRAVWILLWFLGIFRQCKCSAYIYMGMWFWNY